MSRVAKNPVAVPSGVQVAIKGSVIEIKGPKGQLHLDLHPDIGVNQADNQLQVEIVKQTKGANAMSGTVRALLNNMVTGVSKGFERKLELVGVGYRAQAQGKALNLTLGFSHPVSYPVPAGITIETPSQTEILIKGADKQVVGQVAAELRAIRPPEPYKGKGVRYSTEKIVLKEAKKK
ncbi:MAG: 50S ribosomal protein L6 [Gammaproteobacteria bacterium]|nr:50S ribosomal protein L6 [Gammaproteobacteria bacterium]